jgi:hypothetical protein
MYVRFIVLFALNTASLTSVPHYPNAQTITRIYTSGRSCCSRLNEAACIWLRKNASLMLLFYFHTARLGPYCPFWVSSIHLYHKMQKYTMTHKGLKDSASIAAYCCGKKWVLIHRDRKYNWACSNQREFPNDFANHVDVWEWLVAFTFNFIPKPASKSSHSKIKMINV